MGTPLKAVGGRRERTDCQQVLPIDDFYQHSQRQTTTQSMCKACNKARAKALRLLNPSRSYDACRRSRIKRAYGMTWEAFVVLVAEQGNACAICRDPLDAHKRNRRAHVDHDHKTGEVRGILCGRCNPALGAFRDRPELLEAAAQYLRQRAKLKLVG